MCEPIGDVNDRWSWKIKYRTTSAIKALMVRIPAHSRTKGIL